MNAIKIRVERIAEVTEAAFELHPIDYYRRIAAILEGLEGWGFLITSRIIVLARVLAHTGTNPRQVVAAWELSYGDNYALVEADIYARMEAWSSEE